MSSEKVRVDFPLLLSKTSLKKAATILDMENCRAVLLKQPVPLEFYLVDNRNIKFY